MNIRSNLKKIAAAFVTVAACLFVTAKPILAQSDGLVGTWIVQIQIHNCVTGDAINTPFFSLLTFDRGGTMTETTANSSFYPAFRGPAHGVWRETALDGPNRTFTSSQVALITSEGVLTEGQVVRQTIVIGSNSNSFEAPVATIEFYNSDFKLTRKGCATAKGTRFE